MHWIIGPLKKYADFGGRASRREFWIFMLFVTVVTAIGHYTDVALGTDTPVTLRMGICELSITLLLLLPSITAGVRRLHDTGRSGWWMMLIYLPWLATLASDDNGPLALVAAGALLTGGLVWIILLLLPGDKGDNMFGAPPA